MTSVSKQNSVISSDSLQLLLISVETFEKQSKSPYSWPRCLLVPVLVFTRHADLIMPRSWQSRYGSSTLASKSTATVTLSPAGADDKKSTATFCRLPFRPSTPVRTRLYGSCSFAIRGSAPWNSLPAAVRDLFSSSSRFCSRFKAELFAECMALIHRSTLL